MASRPSFKAPFLHVPKCFRSRLFFLYFCIFKAAPPLLSIFIAPFHITSLPCLIPFAPHLCFQMPPSPVIVFFFFSSAFPPYSDYFVLALLFLSPLFPFLSSRPIRLQPFNCFSKYFHIYSPFFPAFSVPAIPCLPPLIYSSAPPRCRV